MAKKTKIENSTYCNEIEGYLIGGMAYATIIQKMAGCGIKVSKAELATHHGKLGNKVINNEIQNLQKSDNCPTLPTTITITITPSETLKEMAVAQMAIVRQRQKEYADGLIRYPSAELKALDTMLSILHKQGLTITDIDFWA